MKLFYTILSRSGKYYIAKAPRKPASIRFSRVWGPFYLKTTAKRHAQADMMKKQIIVLTEKIRNLEKRRSI